MKKITALILALALLLSLTVTAAAAIPSNATIKSAVSSIDSAVGQTDFYDFNPKDYNYAIDFPLWADMFEWDGLQDGSGLYREAVTSRHISEARVKVLVDSKTGAASSVIDSVSIVQSSTATVRVRFKTNTAPVAGKSFSAVIYLSINGSRDYTSEFRLEGSIANNIGGADISDGDFVDISDGRTIQPSSAAKNVELYLGEDVTMKVNLSARTRYSGTASQSYSSSDESLMRKFSSLDKVITIKQSNLSKSGKYVSINSGQDYYVYNAERQYLGRSNTALPFSSKYYLSTKKIDMGGDTDDEDEPPTSKASSSTASSAPTNKGAVIGKDDAVSKTKSALAKSKAATVEYKDASSVTAATLQAMNTTAKNAGGKVSLTADTLNGKTVQGRITIPTAGAEKLKADTSIKLGVYTGTDKTSSTKAYFEKWFSNKIAVVSLDQKSDFGMTVSVAAKVDLSSFKSTTKLYLYSYDKADKDYQLIDNANASVDKNGYLRFSTTVGGEIVITDSPLKKK